MMLNKREVLGGSIASASSLFAWPEGVSASATDRVGQKEPMSASPTQLQSATMHCIGFAERMLQSDGEFYPFGAAINAAGVLESRGAWTGDGNPDVKEIYGLLAQAFRKDAQDGNILVSALAVNVNIPAIFASTWPDGIRVHVESRDYSRCVYVPYKVGKSGLLGGKRKVELGAPFGEDVEHQFFVDTPK